MCFQKKIWFFVIIFIFISHCYGCSKHNHKFSNYIYDNNANYEYDGTETACCEHKGCYETDTRIAVGTKLKSGIKFNTLNVENNKVYGKVSNKTTTFSFLNEIQTIGINKYVVSFDIFGNDIINSKNVTLELGDNTFYITEFRDDEVVNNYEVTIRRKLVYTVKFNMNGGTNCDEQKVEEDDLIKEPITSKIGYTFDKWSYDINLPVTEDLFIEAYWTPNIYTINFDSNGGDLDNSSMNVQYDSKFHLPTPIKLGYAFDGWYCGESMIVDSIWKKDFNVDLVAKWELITYNIKYILNGGINYNNNPTSYTYETSEFNIIEPSKTGYTFVGWTTDLNNNPEKIINVPQNSIGNIIVYANWKANIYNVTFDVNGGNALEESLHEIKYDSICNFPIPTKSGYIFDGWYNGDTEFTDKIWQSVTDLNLVAKWKIEYYGLYYELYGGDNNENNPSYYTYESDDFIICEPTKIGYTFVGWSTSLNNIPQKTINISHNSTGNLTFYANWEANVYTVLFDVCGGDSLSEAFYELEYDSFCDFPIPTRDEYYFDGWYYNDELITANQKWNFTENITVFARWSLVKIYTENGITYMEFGKYPQTIVDDVNLITKLNSISNTTNLGYIEYKGDEYSKTIATPTYSNYLFSNNEKIVEGNTYYFKVEPIKWIVLQTENQNYKLLMNQIIDCCIFFDFDYFPYDHIRTANGHSVSLNNYEYSNVRAWLNGYDGTSWGHVSDYTEKGFYNIAFSPLQKSIINCVRVDNSYNSIDGVWYSYLANDTNDYVYLLSVTDIKNTNYGFKNNVNVKDPLKIAMVTDYAKCRGANYWDYKGDLIEWYGFGSWLLRSPGYYMDENWFVLSVAENGVSDYRKVNSKSSGIRAAIDITLK